MPSTDLQLHFPDRPSWRAWLRANHARERVLWMIFFKKHTGRPCISLDAAIEEALCFGWIDSLVRRVDDETYMRKFTPRLSGSVWSEANKSRVRRLLRARRMTKAGLAAVTFPLDPAADIPAAEAEDARLPGHLLQLLQSNARAWTFFSGETAGRRRLAVGWVLDAKRDETRRSRLLRLMAMYERGERPGLL